MRLISEIWQDDPELALDLLEERAAIIAEGTGAQRNTAESVAAQEAGFRNFTEASMKIKARMKEMRR